MIVYKTTNLINGKIYIGQDANNNPRYLGSGFVLKQAIEKYGRENFNKEILEFCNESNLDQREIYWIKEYNSTDKTIGYNRTDGGGGGNTRKHMSEEEITNYNNKIRNTMLEVVKNPKYIKKLSDSVKRRLIENPEYVKNLSIGVRRAFLEGKGVEQRKISMKKVIHTEEWNKKVGNNNTIRFHIKKIRYFLENEMDIKTISHYFNINEDKINETLKLQEGFDKEPNIDILLEAYHLYENGLKINTIHSKMANAPAKLQMKTFFELKKDSN